MDLLLFLVLVVGLCTAVYIFVSHCYTSKNWVYRLVIQYLNKYIQNFSCGECVFKEWIVIKKFVLSTNPDNLHIPRVLLSFNVLQIETHIFEWWRLDFTHYLVVIYLEGLVVELPSLCFQGIMDPNRKPKPKSLPSFGAIHKFITFFQFFVQDMDIKVGFPDIDTKINAKCTYFEATFARHKIDKESLVVKLNKVYDGHVELIHNDIIAVDYYGTTAMIEVNIDIPTEKMCVEVFLHEKDSVRIRMDDFLKFFTKFQNCEDNAIEIKLTLGKSLTGKMKHLQVHIEDMCVIASDQRSQIPIAVNLEDVHVSMKTTVLDQVLFPAEVKTNPNSRQRDQLPIPETGHSVYNDDIDVSQLPPPLLSRTSNSISSIGDYIPDFDILLDDYNTNVEKSMSIQMGSLRFLGPSKPCFVRKINVNITKVAVNSGDYIDDETMNVNIDSVIFGELDTLYLNWCLIAQQLADQIPNSRFGHVKRDRMTLTVRHADVSLSPFDNHLTQLMNMDNENKFIIDGGNEALEDQIKITHKDGIRCRVKYLIDEKVHGVVSKLVLHKQKEARSLVSNMQLSIASSDVDVSFNAHTLEDRHSLLVGGHKSISTVVVSPVFNNDTPIATVSSLQSPTKTRITGDTFPPQTPIRAEDSSCGKNFHHDTTLLPSHVQLTDDSRQHHEQYERSESGSNVPLRNCPEGRSAPCTPQSSVVENSDSSVNYVIVIAFEMKVVEMDFTIGPAFVLNSVEVLDVLVYEDTETFHIEAVDSDDENSDYSSDGSSICSDDLSVNDGSGKSEEENNSEDEWLRDRMESSMEGIKRKSSTKRDKSNTTVVRSQLFHMSQIYVIENDIDASSGGRNPTEKYSQLLIRMEYVTSSIGFSSFIKFLYSVSMIMDTQDRVVDKIDRMKAITMEQTVRDSELYKEPYMNNGACCCLLNNLDHPCGDIRYRHGSNDIKYCFPVVPPKPKKEMVVKCKVIDVILYVTENLMMCMDTMAYRKYEKSMTPTTNKASPWKEKKMMKRKFPARSQFGSPFDQSTTTSVAAVPTSSEIETSTPSSSSLSQPQLSGGSDNIVDGGPTIRRRLILQRQRSSERRRKLFRDMKSSGVRKKPKPSFFDAERRDTTEEPIPQRRKSLADAILSPNLLEGLKAAPGLIRVGAQKSISRAIEVPSMVHAELTGLLKKSLDRPFLRRTTSIEPRGRRSSLSNIDPVRRSLSLPPQADVKEDYEYGVGDNELTQDDEYPSPSSAILKAIKKEKVHNDLIDLFTDDECMNEGTAGDEVGVVPGGYDTGKRLLQSGFNAGPSVVNFIENNTMAVVKDHVPSGVRDGIEKMHQLFGHGESGDKGSPISCGSGTDSSTDDLHDDDEFGIRGRSSKRGNKVKARSRSPTLIGDELEALAACKVIRRRESVPVIMRVSTARSDVEVVDVDSDSDNADCGQCSGVDEYDDDDIFDDDRDAEIGDEDYVNPYLFKKPEFFFEFHFEEFSWKSREPKSSISFDKMIVWANTSSLYTEEFCVVNNFAFNSLDVHYTHAILTHSSISMDNFIVNMNPTVHLGYAIDALLQQKEAWLNAKSPPPTDAMDRPPSPNISHAGSYVEGSSSYMRHLILLREAEEKKQHQKSHHYHRHHHRHHHHHQNDRVPRQSNDFAEKDEQSKTSHAIPANASIAVDHRLKPKEVLSTLKVKLNRFDISTHVMYDGLLIHKFATVAYENLEVLIDSRLGHQKVCMKIAEFDSNSFTPGLEYTGINGGYLKLKADEFYVSFSMMTKKYYSISNMAMEGYLYSASVKEKRILVKEKYLCLSDSHLRSFREFSAKTNRNGGFRNHHTKRRTAEDEEHNKESVYLAEKNFTFQERNPSHVDETTDFREKQEVVNNFIEAGIIGYTSPTLRGLVVQSPAQSKIYTKLQINAQVIENFQDVETAKYHVAFMDDLFSHCLPPSTDPSPPLMWWDSVRYWAHGQVTFVVKKLIYSQARQVSRGLTAPLTLEITMRKLFMFFDRQSFEMNGSDLIITVESKDTQKNMLSMRRVTSRRGNLGDSSTSGRSSRGMGRPQLQPPKQILRWKLCNIPCVSLSIANTPATHHSDNTPNDVFNDGVYDHHDVYCRPAFEDTYENRKHLNNFDKFAHFRMKRKSSKWGILINFNDSPNNVILLFFRLDIIERLKLAFSAPTVDTTDDAFHQIIKLQEDTHNFLYGEYHGEAESTPTVSSKQREAERKEKYLIGRKRYVDSLVNDISMCITDMDLHLKLDKFLACSWPSSLILDGAVFSQDSLCVDIQLVNQDIEEGCELDAVQELTNLSPECESGEYVNKSPSNTIPREVAAYHYPTTGLQVKHVNGSVERIEVYFREWRIEAELAGTRNSSTRSRESFFHVPQSAGECHTIQHIRSLFEPIFKLAHATRIEFKYDDDISSTNNLFPSYLLPPLIPATLEQRESVNDLLTTIPHMNPTSIGEINSDVNGGPGGVQKSTSNLDSSHTPFPPPNSFHTKTSLNFNCSKRHNDHQKLENSRPSLIDSRSEIALDAILQKNVSGKEKSRPHIMSFRANHALCRPPDSALPMIQEGDDQSRRPPAHAMDMVNSFMRKSMILNQSRRHLLRNAKSNKSSSLPSIKQSSRWLRSNSSGLLVYDDIADRTDGNNAKKVSQQIRIAALTIVDIRLLWTCVLRDNLSIFINQVSESLATNAPLIEDTSNGQDNITANSMTPFPCGLPDPGVESKKQLARKASLSAEENPDQPQFNHRTLMERRRDSVKNLIDGKSDNIKRHSRRHSKRRLTSDQSSIKDLKSQLNLVDANCSINRPNRLDISRSPSPTSSVSSRASSLTASTHYGRDSVSKLSVEDLNDDSANMRSIMKLRGKVLSPNSVDSNTNTGISAIEALSMDSPISSSHFSSSSPARSRPSSMKLKGSLEMISPIDGGSGSNVIARTTSLDGGVRNDKLNSSSAASPRRFSSVDHVQGVSPVHTPTQRKRSDVATMADIRKFNPNMILEGVDEDGDNPNVNATNSRSGRNESVSGENSSSRSTTGEYGVPLSMPVFDVYGNMIVNDSGSQASKQKKKQVPVGTLPKGPGGINRGGGLNTQGNPDNVDVLKYFHVDESYVTPPKSRPKPIQTRRDSISGKRDSMSRRTSSSATGGATRRRSSIMNMSLTQKEFAALAGADDNGNQRGRSRSIHASLPYAETSPHTPRSHEENYWSTPDPGDEFYTPSPPKMRKTASNESHYKNEKAAGENEQNEKDKDKNIPRKFFTLELKNPQVNFLDQKSQSSMLIVVAGKSTVEGKKHKRATVTVHGGGEIEAPKRKNDIELHMDGVSAYTVSTYDEDSDINNMVYWKALDHTQIDMSKHTEGERFGIGGTTKGTRGRRNKNSIHTGHDSPGSGGLSMAIEHFQIRFFHTFYEDITIMEAMKLKESDFQQTKEDLMSAFFLDLPELCLKVDPLQFYMFLKVIRNVLLAPPPKQVADDEDKRQLEAMEKRNSLVNSPLSTGGAVASNSNSNSKSKPSAFHLKSNRARKEMREMIEKELNAVNTEYSLAQHIEFFVGRGTWLMCDSGSSEVMLEVGFMGFFGRHQNHEDLSSSSEIELQRFWIRDCLGNTVDSAPPTSATDGTIYSRIHQKSNKAVTGVKNRWKSKKNVDISKNNDTTAWALMPTLEKNDYCTRCGSAFNVKENSSDSCRFHADSEGTLGEYKEYTVVDNSTLLLSKQSCWSCCLDPSRTAEGCSVRPHLCQEAMVSIRTESKPSVTIANTFDFTVIEKLDIDIFPGAAYVIKIIITRQLVDMLHKYFYFNEEDAEKTKKEGDKDDNDEGKNEHKNSDKSSDKSSDKARESKGKKQSGNKRSKAKSERTNSDSESEASSRGHGTERSRKSKHSGDNSKDDTASVRSGGSKRSKRGKDSHRDEEKEDEPEGEEEVQVKATLQEAVYIRQYLRVGEINVEVSTIGFALNLTEYQAVIDYYDNLRGDVLLWSDVMGKLEYHAIWSVSKHTATNSMNRIWEAIVGREEENFELDEDEERRKVQLLLGA